MPFNPFKIKPVPIHAHRRVDEDAEDDSAVAQRLEEEVERVERRNSMADPFADEEEVNSYVTERETRDTPLSFQQTPAIHNIGHQHYQSISDENTPIFRQTPPYQPYQPGSFTYSQPAEQQSITPVPVQLPAHPLQNNYNYNYNDDIEKGDIKEDFSYQSRSPSPDDDSYEGMYNNEALTSPAPIAGYTPDLDTSHYGAPPEERIRRRGKTKKKVALTDGNLVVDLPIPSTLDKVIMRRDLEDMSKVRYTAVTCDPDHFEKEQFTLRQSLGNRRTELAICITMYNEDEVLFCRTLYGVMKNISHLCSRKNSSTWGIDAWTKVVVVIVADGRTKVHPRVLDCLASLGVYQEGVAKGAVNDKNVEAHLFEYTTSLALGPDLKFKGPEKRIVPTQIIFCLKEKNAKKINSHRWFFNGICPVLQPNICVLLDVGTRPHPKSIYHLWKAFDKNSNVGGACGEIRADTGKHGRALLNPIVASQNFEYKMSNILDKPTESIFGYISVLPGAFSAYRYVALKNDDNFGLGPLHSYFKGETIHMSENESVFTRNMMLAEDRILCFELCAKRKEAWTLKYVKSAVGVTDVPDRVPELISQRRRWLNGSFFAAIYALTHTGQILNSGHSKMRKSWLLIETFYAAINLFFSWFALGNFYCFFVVLTRALEDPSFGIPGIKFFNLVAQAVYGAMIIACFTFSMGNRPAGASFKYTAVMCVFAVLSIYMVVAAIICTVHVAQQSEHNAMYAQMLISLIATYGLWVAASLISLDPWHLFTSFPQYLLLAASYINVLTTFAFSNLHDLTWGTKGDNVPEQNTGKFKTSKDGLVEVEMYDNKPDLDGQYADALHKLRTKMPIPQAPPSAADRERAAADYLASFRSNVLLCWILCNGALIIAVLVGTGGDGAFGDNGNKKVQAYMLIILAFVAITSVPRIASRAYASEAGAADKLKLKFALPHETLYQDKEVIQVSVPAETGEMGILSHHVPSVEALKSGVVEVIEAAGQSKKYFISSGFASVHPNNTLTINAVEAFELSAFDKSAIKQGIQDAQKLKASGSEVEKAEAEIELDVYSELEAALKISTRVLLDDDTMLDLIRVYLIIIENDGKNRDYFSTLSNYADAFIRSSSFPHDNDIINAIVLWIDYLLNSAPDNITPYKPFIFGAHKYDSFYAPWVYSVLPNNNFNFDINNSFLTNLELTDNSVTLIYFNNQLKLQPPLSSHAAFLSLLKYQKQLPQPSLNSKDFDLEFVRLTSCIDPSTNPGCSATLYKDQFKGPWEGFFCYYEFDHYRDMLSGSLDSLYNGNYVIQPQVWKLNESINSKQTQQTTNDQSVSITQTNEFVNKPSPSLDTIDLDGIGHSAWGRFTLRGKVRPWDGMFMLCKEYTPDRRGKWFYRGYALPGGVLVGRWRDTYTPEVMSGYEHLHRFRHLPAIQSRSFRYSLRNLKEEFDSEHLETPQSLQQSKVKFDLKYADRLADKVKEEGVENLDELRKKLAPAPAPAPTPAPKQESEKPANLESIEQKQATTPQPDQLKVDTGRDEYFVGSVDKIEGRKEGDGTGVKPLDTILNVEKMRELPDDHISKLWNAHHATKDNHLSASIERSTYESIYQQARKFPAFVLPIPREVEGEDMAKKMGYEVFYLEWGFLPDVNGTGVRPTTLIFTSLNEYKQRQAFATPFVSCTHYSDFAHTHNLVLMRGEITSVGSGDSNLTVLDSKDAQLLLLTMQRFYNAHKHADQSNKDRAKLLSDFHYNQSQFDFERLCQLVEEI
ncbi:hypothetical protein E3Q23_01082 [Wallemia mellicola]|nr:hypothetical protein E3Q23_01082 [Wallemia mellicola]TIC29563.1 glycosyltransferase family 2 protein [Wallemia mellicola]TIC75090.1 glycosyltransferase family 2 protein [Wallemia mellicola]